MKSPVLPTVHQAAVRRVLALGRSGDPAALAPLTLQSPHPQTQQYAIRALKKYGSASRRRWN